ncbi:MAG: hypothetical protein ACYS1E_19470, partial [Planctomycetota bacterium]
MSTQATSGRPRPRLPGGGRFSWLYRVPRAADTLDVRATSAPHPPSWWGGGALVRAEDNLADEAPQTSRLETLDDVVAQVMARQRAVRLSGLRGAARGVVAAQLVRAHGERPVLVLVPNAKAGDAFLDDLRAALGEAAQGGRVRPFPRHDTQPYERFSPQPFLVAQRMDVLYRWLASPKPGNGAAAMREPAPVVVAPWTALALRVPPREAVRARSVHLEVGQTLDRDALV